MSHLADHDIRSAIRGRFKVAFRRRVGAGRPWTVAALVEETGLNERTVRSYQADDGNLPGLAEFFQIAAALGPDFLNEVLDVAGFEGARATAAADPSAATAQLAVARAAFQLAEWLADGQLDHRERREAIPAMLALVDRVQAFVAGLQAAEAGQ